jgi:holo-[acyl-carrier protein] synthase
MIVGIGTDIVSLKKLKQVIDRHGDRFFEKILTKKERDRWSSLQFVGGRFAAKEAIIKCLSDFLDVPVPFNEIEINNDEKGKPSVNFLSPQVKYQSGIGSKFKFWISISHSGEYASATAILEKNDK